MGKCASPDRMSEESLAASVVAWLADSGWEVYQEVQMKRGPAVADIVAVSGPVAWVVEVKASLSLSVMGQAWAWRPWAHLVSVAAPTTTNWRGRAFVEEVARRLGFGVLGLGGEGSVFEWVRPAFHRRVVGHPGSALRAALREEHKTFARAGNAKGRRFTPFAATCRAVRSIVEAEPGISARDLMEKMAGRHHYSSPGTARACLIRWADRGIIEGVRLERAGRRLSFHPNPSP